MSIEAAGGVSKGGAADVETGCCRWLSNGKVITAHSPPHEPSRLQQNDSRDLLLYEPFRPLVHVASKLAVEETIQIYMYNASDVTCIDTSSTPSDETAAVIVKLFIINSYSIAIKGFSHHAWPTP